jgi:hypothetical protein
MAKDNAKKKAKDSKKSGAKKAPKTVRVSAPETGRRRGFDPKTFQGLPEALSGMSSPAPRLRMEPLPIDTSAHKFDINPAGAPVEFELPAYEYLGELPEAYGTRKLFLVPRDPHWLYAYWDLTREQFQEAERSAHDGKVFLQLYHEAGDRVQQIQIHGGGREWYLHVPEAGTSFFAELGYYGGDGCFHVLGRSRTVVTPPDSISWKTHAEFVTIPFHFSFRQLQELVASNRLPGEELAETLARLQKEGFPFPFEIFAGHVLSDEQHEALLDYMRGDFIRRFRMGSIDVTELVRGRAGGGAEASTSSGQWLPSMSSPGGSSWSGGLPRDFYLHVNAELIFYGGTDPKAKVRIDGEEIALRPDGTFSYHFTFKDGRYHIPITATSPDGKETRSALLSFLRISEYSPGVEKTGQPPLPEPLGKAD